MKHLSILTAALLLMTACSSGGSGEVTRAFYFWKSGHLENLEEHMLAESATEKLYVKLFEIELDNLEGAIPYDKTYLKLPAHVQEELDIVACVFINNEVIAKSTNEQLDALAENTAALTQKYIDGKLSEDQKTPVQCSEIQIDCDWMESSKDQYFYFLKALRKRTDKTISCTLRLYPYKFSNKMGVPPVDRVMLLCYNLLNPQPNTHKNSILDIGELKKYIQTDEAYPLPVDVSFPCYSSCYVFENAKFESVQHGIPRDLEDICLPSDDGLWYVVAQDTSLDWEYYRKGQRLKIERVSPTALLEAVKLVAQHVTLADDATVGLYHLDEEELKHYRHETLDSVYLLFNQR